MIDKAYKAATKRRSGQQLVKSIIAILYGLDMDVVEDVLGWLERNSWKAWKSE